MKRNLIALTVLVAMLAAILLPVATPSASAATVHRTHAAAFDKTKFVLHLGVAAFLVHYVYKKYKAGQLSRRHLFTVLKAAAAVAIAYHEMKVAYSIAQGSNSKTLKLLIAPITALTSRMSSVTSRLRHGDTSGVSSLNSQEGAFTSLAGHNGYSVKDQQPAGFGGF